MATSIQTLIPFVTTIALLLTVSVSNASRVPKPKLPSKTTSFSYDFRTTKPTDLTYQGDAHFPSGAAVLRLTKTDEWGYPMNLSPGRVLYTKPVRFWEKKAKAGFETNVKFIITAVPDDELQAADGLVFFITAVNSTVNEPGGSLGVFDASGKNPSVFAVEFDIYVNEDFDPSYRHVGIDIGSQVSKNVTSVADAIVGKEVSACIKYDAATNLISVRGNADGQGFELSYVYDLSSFLPQQVQVGISAATGGAVAYHDVISWSFSSSMVRKKHF